MVDKNRTQETVYTSTQRERSRPFKEKLKSYTKEIKKRLNKPKVSRSFISQEGLSKGEKARRIATFISDRSSRGVRKGLSMLQKGAVTRRLYGQPVAPYGSNISNVQPVRRTGRRGRPRGSVKYRDAQGNPIGVYEYRKLLSQKRWKERQEILQRSVTNPTQLARLRQIQDRDEMLRRSPESQTIPDTFGNVQTKTIHDEINFYANLVD